MVIVVSDLATPVVMMGKKEEGSQPYPMAMFTSTLAFTVKGESVCCE